MSKILFIAFFMCSNATFAENAYEIFDATKNITSETTIEWVKVNDLQDSCEKESKKRGLGGFGYPVEACSFWGKRSGKDVCQIITEKTTSMATLGHEIRHCFQGAFH